MAPVEQGLGLGVHLAGLRSASLPNVYGLDAVVLMALPLGIVAWLAGNVGFSRARRA
jgi:hypothetical protein